MADNYIGEIRMVGFTYATEGWLLCNGALYQISQFEALYTLIGTTYGGDGVTTFGVPDLRSRLPMCQGQGPGLSNYTLGQQFGVKSVTLNANTTAPHTHLLAATSDSASTNSPANALLAGTAPASPLYSNGTPNATLSPTAVSPSGGSQPHNNIEPCQGQLFMIAFTGIYPSQT